MAKRFTDTMIWDKPWFMSLSLKHKCLVRYIFDKCDAAGVWEPNWILASLQIGESVNEDDLKSLAGQIEQLEKGKIWIPDFINFQCGKLSEASPAHKPIFTSLKKHNLLDRVLNRLQSSLQEKEIDKDKEKEKDNTAGEVFVTDKLIENFFSMPEHKKSITYTAKANSITYEKACEMIADFFEKQQALNRSYPRFLEIKSHALNSVSAAIAKEREKQGKDLGQKHTTPQHKIITKL